MELLPGADEVVRLTHRLTASGDRRSTSRPGRSPSWTSAAPASSRSRRPTCIPANSPRAATTLPEEFLPNREFVLWPFTDLTDGRYRFSEHFLRLSYRAGLPATKLGLKVPTGWIAYENKGLVFAKHFARRTAPPTPTAA